MIDFQLYKLSCKQRNCENFFLIYTPFSQKSINISIY
nr:MAG TPA: hypothetical protein [Caudoviricetes sp.]